MLVRKVLSVLILSSCAIHSEPVQSKKAACRTLASYGKNVEITFELMPDTHGYVGAMRECREKPFGVDLSSSDFNDPANSELFRRSAVSSLIDHVPIEVKAEGKFVRRSRATVLLVKKISLAHK